MYRARVISKTLHGSRGAVGASAGPGARRGAARAMATRLASGWVLFSLKDMRAHDAFSGTEEDFEVYFTILETEVEELGWSELWEAAISRGAEPISMEDFVSDDVRAVSKNLYTLLMLKMRGKAHTLVKLAGRGNGFEALRAIYNDYRPRGQVTDSGMIGAIVHPTWWCKDGHQNRAFLDVLHDWDELVARYEVATDERLSDRLKASVITTHVPKKIKEMLAGCNRQTRESYDELRNAIRLSCIEKGEVGKPVIVPVAPAATGNDPMNVDAIGFDKDHCSICKKPGHDADKCWWKGKGGGKGKGKDGGGKGGLPWRTVKGDKVDKSAGK